MTRSSAFEHLHALWKTVAVGLYLVLPSALLSPTPVSAQVALRAMVDDNEVYEGSFFKVSFEINTTGIQDFEAPDFEGFKVASGPSRSSQTTIVNGRASGMESFAYTLQAVQTGTFDIGPAVARTRHGTYTSRPVQIKVLPPKIASDITGQAIISNEQYFVIAELSEDTIYNGQVAVLDYRLYTKVNIARVQLEDTPDLSDFERSHDPTSKFNTETVEIDGVPYTTKIISRIFLYPKRAGTFDFYAARATVYKKKQSRRSFFFNDYDTDVLTTNHLTLTVREVPSPRPPSYSGLVGSWDVDVSTYKRNYTTDDAVSVFITASGEGHTKRLNPASLPASPNLDNYTPTVKGKDENTKNARKHISIEYLFTASEPGEYFIVPEFSWFDTDSNQFNSLDADTFYFSMSQGSGVAPLAGADSLAYIKTGSGHSMKRTLLIDHRSWRLTWLALFLLTGGLTAFNFIRDRTKKPAPSPKEETLRRLHALRDQADRDIAHRIEEITGDFLRHTFELEESEWSMATLEKKMTDFDENEMDAIRSLFDTLSFAAYSGVKTKQRLDWIDRAVGIVESVSTTRSMQ